MQLPQWLARFNRHVTNPIQRLWAGYIPTMGILEHVGRRSGRQFRTPLTVFSTDEGVAILLTYGPDRDWLKNITAAGDFIEFLLSSTIQTHLQEFGFDRVSPEIGFAQREEVKP